MYVSAPPTTSFNYLSRILASVACPGDRIRFQLYDRMANRLYRFPWCASSPVYTTPQILNYSNPTHRWEQWPRAKVLTPVSVSAVSISESVLLDIGEGSSVSR